MPDPARLPNWADDLGDVLDFVINAHGISTNIPREGATGTSVHIGIVDSAYRLSDHVTSGYTVRQSEERSFIDTDEEETTFHCSPVFNLLSSYCPGATFSLYQVVTEDRTLPLDAYSDAISAAIEDGVDILNVSAGDPWRGPVRTNPNVLETQRAIDEEIMVVAAAGNWKPNQDTRPPVHCPAALNDVIAVGGMVSGCPVSPGDEPSDETKGPYYVLKDEAYEYPELTPEGPFCGQEGCVDGKSCITNQTEKPWSRNVQTTAGKPDVIAPMHIPVETNDGKQLLKTGTSFAAPIVTGSLGCILDELRRSDVTDPTPYQMRQATIDGAVQIDEGKLSKFDAMGVRKVLGLLD